MAASGDELPPRADRFEPGMPHSKRDGEPRYNSLHADSSRRDSAGPAAGN